MNQLLLIALLILSGVLSISMINYFTNRSLKRYSQDENDKIGINALKAILFICTGLLVSEVGGASKEVLNIQLLSLADNLILVVASYFALFLCISLVVLFLSIWFSKMVFAVLTKGKNIYEAASKNETASLILFSGIVICISIIGKSGLGSLLLNSIHYSSTPIFH